MSVGVMQNIAAYVKAVIAAVSQTAAGAVSIVTAGATEDGQKVTGSSIDCLGFDSAAFVLAARATLAASETLSIAVEIQESSDNSTWDTAVALQASTALLTDSGSGSTIEDELEIAVDLSGRKRYVRFNVTPTMSAGSTDTANWSALAILGGARDSTDC